ncbi:hypothetical protein GCM10011495_29380 [Hymenobacter frigidus]|uniref:Type I restriction modification DNA specificity domain-containing protein n=1 Tax=Hymenobacter frigidus TaxID=1524095 RepID=A0ABQ2ABL6_9BACT|nr:restriction endonuclease subunit S [Hymenobacter frigidus]GGH88341.1 hypothetical protein GCM10011495_29380 [Hymenobacter frigidus]
MMWRKVSLGEVCELRYGKSLVKETRVQDGAYPVYGSSGIVGHHDEFLVDGPCLVVGRKGSIGTVFFSERPCYPIDTAYFVHCKEEINLRFLYYQLSTLRLSELNKAAAVPGLNREDAYRKLITLPPLDVQHQIADTLDKADALRRKDQELLQKYNELAQSIFYEMFGDPIENTKKWEVKSLGELTRKITDGTHQTPTYVESGVPFLRVTDLTGSNTSKKFITREEHLTLTKRCKPERGDVLYSKNGTIGVAKVVDWDYEFSIFVSLCLLKVKTELLNPKFLEFFLNTPFALNQAKKHSKTGTVTNLHLNEIKNILVPVPERVIQEQFLHAVTSIEAQKSLVRHSEGLFDTVLNSHF